MNHSAEANLFNEFCNNFATNVENFLKLDYSNSSIGTNSTNSTLMSNISNEEDRLQLSTDNSPSYSTVNIVDGPFATYPIQGLSQSIDSDKLQNDNYVISGSNAQLANFPFEASISDFSNSYPTYMNSFSNGETEKRGSSEESYKYLPTSKNKLIGNIYHYSEKNPTRCTKVGQLRLKKNALNCYHVSKAIRMSIKKELKLEELYENGLKSGKLQFLKGKTKKRRNPISDVLIWEPLSLFTAFTNFKTSHFENTDYFDNIPQTSCVGKINMRMKRAWIRGPNKEKVSRKDQEEEQEPEEHEEREDSNDLS